MAERKEGLSQELDELSSDLFGEALDLLAAGEHFGALLVVESEQGEVSSLEFSDDGQEACLEAARDKVKNLASSGNALRYALVYEGAVADEEDAFLDALIMEFGEKDYKNYSAFSFIENIGGNDNFIWSDPAPAGELEPLL